MRDLAEESSGHQARLSRAGTWPGGAASNLAELVRRVELLIILTDVNSHGAVQFARRLARQQRVPLLLLRRCGPARFAEILRNLGSAKTDVLHA